MGANTVGQAIVSTAVAYLDNVVTYPYINSKFAILSRIKDDYGQDIIRTMPEYGEGFAFREIVGGTASDYDTDTGFGADCGATADYTVVKGYYDREFPARTDWASEMNTVLQGGTPTIVGKVAATWKNFGAEIDAVTAAYIYDKAKESNKHLNTDSKYATNSGSAIVSTLLRIKNDLYDQGVDGIVYCFISSEVYAELERHLLSSYGLANPAIVSKSNLKIPVSATPEKIAKLGSDLMVNSEILEMDNLILIKVPSSRMHTKVTLRDRDSGGGFVPATTETGYGKIDILAVPENAALLGIRHAVSNMSLPMSCQGYIGAANKCLADINDGFYGLSEIQLIGVNQTADAFVCNNRVMYRPMVTRSRGNLIVAVTGQLKS